MDSTHTFRLSGDWEGPQTGRIQAETVDAPLAFSAPVEFRGTPGFWTPEHFLLGAIASCFLTTFHAIAANSKLECPDIRVAVEGDVSHQPNGWQFTGVRLKVKARIRREEDRERTAHLIEKAERACIVSRAMRMIPELSTLIEVAEPKASEAEIPQTLEVAGSSASGHDSGIL
jgi:peroxiredoxin-like protein